MYFEMTWALHAPTQRADQVTDAVGKIFVLGGISRVHGLRKSAQFCLIGDPTHRTAFHTRCAHFTRECVRAEHGRIHDRDSVSRYVHANACNAN